MPAQITTSSAGRHSHDWSLTRHTLNALIINGFNINIFNSAHTCMLLYCSIVETSQTSY